MMKVVVTGIKGNIVEKHLNLSKAKDTVSAVNPPQKTYYKDYLALYSDNLYAGKNPSNAKDIIGEQILVLLDSQQHVLQLQLVMDYGV